MADLCMVRCSAGTSVRPGTCGVTLVVVVVFLL